MKYVYRKKILTTSVAFALLCIVAFASLASAGTPSYTTSATGTGIGGGTVSRANYITGSAPDTSTAWIWAGATGAGGEIICQMSATNIAAGSYISINAAAGRMDVYVYVSDSASGPWQPVGSLAVDALPMDWHSIQSPYSFSYVKISATSSSGYTSMYIDCLLTM